MRMSDDRAEWQPFGVGSLCRGVRVGGWPHPVVVRALVRAPRLVRGGRESLARGRGGGGDYRFVNGAGELLQRRRLWQVGAQRLPVELPELREARKLVVRKGDDGGVCEVHSEGARFCLVGLARDTILKGGSAALCEGDAHSLAVWRGGRVGLDG